MQRFSGFFSYLCPQKDKYMFHLKPIKRMKRPKRLSIAVVSALAMTLFAQPVQAQERVDEFGIFDHASIGLTLGTTGIGLDLAAPVTDYLTVRAGYNFFPTFKYTEDVDYRAKGKKERGKTEAVAKNYMNTGHVLLDVYPFPDYTFRATAGFYFGEDEVVKLENTIPVKDFEPGEGIVIGNYIVGFDRDGYAHGVIKVKKFRPYVGIGFGRAVPRKRIGVSGDFGVQLWGKPKVYEKQTGKDLEVTRDDLGSDSDKYYDVISKFGVWPVANFRITCRLF